MSDAPSDGSPVPIPAGLVVGVANDHSLGWHIARRLAADGARVGVVYGEERLERRVRPLAESIGAPLCARCDVTDDTQLTALVAEARDRLGSRLDFLVHSVAYAEREDLVGPFVETSRAGFARALDVSAYSLIGLVRGLLPLLGPGSSVLTLTYLGAEQVVSGYKVMGPAKAALECAVRYLAAELGPAGIRVNAVSAGPVRTLAAAGIPGFRELLKGAAERAPLRRNVTAEEIAQAAHFLLSGASSAVTGEVLHVDAGFNIVSV